MTRIQPPKATARQITVMLVDDHASFRASARWLLETEGYAVVAEAASGESALELVAGVQPELVLLDVGLPGIDGFQVALGIRTRCPRTRVVLTSSRDLADLGLRSRERLRRRRLRAQGRALARGHRRGNCVVPLARVR